MIYQTVQHKELSPRITLFRCKRLRGILPVTLICALAMLGCTSEHSSDQAGKQTKPANAQATQAPPQKESTSTAPVQKEVGEASWYGPGFHGKETSSGEIFDQKKMTAAHPSLPIGTKVEVTNLENDKKVEVKINDRGPYVDNRTIDLSSAAADKLKMKKEGTVPVKIETKSAKKKSRTAKSEKNKKQIKKSAPSKQ